MQAQFLLMGRPQLVKRIQCLAPMTNQELCRWRSNTFLILYRQYVIDAHLGKIQGIFASGGLHGNLQ